MEPTDSKAQRGRHGWLVPLTLVALGAWAWACHVGSGTDGSGSADTADAGEDTGTAPGDVSRRDVLESIALQVIVPATAEFSAVASELSAATAALATAKNADPAGATDALTQAQERWREAMTTWQRLEMMQLGPAASSVSAIGGENIRDAIYSWPTVDTCSIDRAIADEDYAQPDFFATAYVYAYGLDALEYLLFVHDAEHTCPAQVQLDVPWTALGFDEIERRRAAYADVLATEIARQAGVLANRWSPAGDDLAALLAEPGAGDSPWASEMQAIDDVFRAMFYADKQTKDGKLGAPLGLVDTCPAAPCPNLMESPRAGLAAQAIAENLRALALMVKGGDDPETSVGFDDLLVQAGHEDIATTLLADIDSAIAVAEAFDEPLQQVVVTDAARVEALYAAVKRVTDTLKGPFVMALMLTIPSEGAGDND